MVEARRPLRLGTALHRKMWSAGALACDEPDPVILFHALISRSAHTTFSKMLLSNLSSCSTWQLKN
jgi:hypothetical protein